jgi:hypothetical protein
MPMLPGQRKWKVPMDKEMKSLQEKDEWDVVELATTWKEDCWQQVGVQKENWS